MPEQVVIPEDAGTEGDVLSVQAHRVSWGLWTALATLALGCTVMLGWWLEVDSLKSVVAGQVTMKMNTAVCMTLLAVALVLLFAESRDARIGFVRKSACGIVAAITLLTLSEDLLQWDAGIDNLLIPDAANAIESLGPGRMSPITAFSFTLCAFALLVARPWRKSTAKSAILMAAGAFLLLVGGLSVLGHASCLTFASRLWNHAGMAMNTATGMALLGLSLWAAAGLHGRCRWALGRLPSAGFALGAACMLAVSGISYQFTSELAAVSGSIRQSEHTLARIDSLGRDMLLVEKAHADYLSSGDGESVIVRDQARARRDAELAALAGFYAGDVKQSDKLGRLTDIIRQTDASPNTGNAGAVRQAMRLLQSLSESENMRQSGLVADSEATSTANYLLLPLGALVCLSLLSAGVFALNANFERRGEIEARLVRSLAEMRDMKTALDAHAIVAFTDSRGKITAVNDKFCALSKYSREELIGKDHRILNSKHHPKEFMQELWSTIRSGRTWHGEIRNRAKDGSIYWVDTTIVPFSGEGGHPMQFVAIRADITEKKLAEIELLESRRRLSMQVAISRILDSAATLGEAARGILQAVADSERWDFGALWAVDGEAGVLRCLETWKRPGLDLDAIDTMTREIVFGKGRGLPGRIWEEDEAILSPDLRNDSNYPRAPLALNAGLRSAFGFPVRIEGAVVLVLDFLSEEAKPVDENLGAVFDAVARQIGLFLERRAAEDQVLKLNADLERRVAERTSQLEAANKELEAFSYSVSHDLRAPLRTIDGYSQAVMEDYGPTLPDEGKRFLGTIRHGAQQMGALIDDLLKFARLSRATMANEPVNMQRLVRLVLEDLRFDFADPRVAMTVGDLPEAHGDRALLRQVWVNLLSNALKYSGRREKAAIEVGAEERTGETVYYVRDNGAGFDMRYADKLFGVFQRLHRAEDYEGTGVGLAIVQRVIHRHGGRVWAESSVDRGATFFFSLKKQDQNNEHHISR